MKKKKKEKKKHTDVVIDYLLQQSREVLSRAGGSGVLWLGVSHCHVPPCKLPPQATEILTRIAVLHHTQTSITLPLQLFTALATNVF